MIHSYMISIKLQANQWSASAIGQNLYVESNLLDLGVLLHTLNECNAITEIKVFRTVTIPSLSRLLQMTREDLNIKDKEIAKVA